MTSFTDTYAKWRSEQFPPGSSRDDLDELHADLVLVDEWVADTVIPYAERGVVVPSAGVDIKQGIRRLADRLASLSEDDHDAASTAIIRQYAHYLALIAEVLSAYELSTGGAA